MSGAIFEVTGEDIARLDSETFDLVWSALGCVIRSRYPWHEPDAPEQTATLPVSVGPVAMPAKKRPPAQTGRKRSPETRERMRQAQLARHQAQRARHAAEHASKSATTLAAGNGSTDFASRAKAAADRTWRENDPEQTA